jgi:hypothetical protein
MKAIIASPAAARPVLSWTILTSGCLGMVCSFHFLASANELDVIAGAAGFVAGSVLVAAGHLAVALRHLWSGPIEASEEAISGPALNVDRWLAHFQSNHQNRPEPDWSAPITLAADTVQPLVRSLEQFQLGDGGGPVCLIAWNAERFLAQTRVTRKLVDCWFAEEREHARLLAGAVARFGGHCIQGHWSFTSFCLVRRWLGVRFELTALLLTEIVSTVYYRLLRRHADDLPLRAACRLILRDEAGHVAFHRDRLLQEANGGRESYGRLWALQFRVLGLAAATVLWLSHAAGLQAVGATRTEFYHGVWSETSRFIRRLRRDLETLPEVPLCP